MDTAYEDWDELVGSALLGTGRRRGGSPEALLDAAAVQTVRRRAGLRPPRRPRDRSRRCTIRGPSRRTRPAGGSRSCWRPDAAGGSAGRRGPPRT